MRATRPRDAAVLAAVGVARLSARTTVVPGAAQSSDSVSTYERRDVEDVIGSGCSEGTLAFLEAEPLETPFVRTTFFAPTDTQWSLGARWAYCVVTLPAPGGLRPGAPRTATRCRVRRVNINFGPNPLNPLDDPARLPGALATCLDAFRA